VTLVLATGCSGHYLFGISAHEAAGACRGSIVELRFDPKGQIEALADGKTVASADVPSRRVSQDSCVETPVPRSYSQQGVRYARLTTPATLTCRFPGRFVVAVYPVTASWSGEQPAGSAVDLVAERRFGPGPGPARTILAGATVMRRSGESDLVFVRRFCRPSTSR
jgi:hypothetical protein